MGDAMFSQEEAAAKAEQFNIKELEERRLINLRIAANEMLSDPDLSVSALKGWSFMYFSGTSAFLKGDFLHPFGYEHKQDISNQF
jgi:hypothetical protein